MKPPELHRARSAQSAQSQYSFEDDDDDDLDFLEAKTIEVPAGAQVIYSLETLERDRQRLLAEAMECTGISEDEAALLLRHCAYDVAVFNEAFFEDGDALRARVGVAEEDMQMSSPEENPLCSICFSEAGESLMPCKAPEVFCRECWRQYLERAVQEGRGCLELRCPAPSCKELVRPSLFASLLSPSLLERYQRFLTESLVDDSRGSLRWCPGRNCSAAAKAPKEGRAGEVQCPCGTLWCFSCGNDVHLPTACETVKRWEEKNRDEGCDVVWIKANTKLCPKCQNPIEKNGGCMHMTCRKPGGCGHEFCWICMKNWRDHRQCNSVEEEVGKQATKHELLRYAHYFERYLAHHKAEQFAAKGLRQASEAIAELFTKSLGVTVSDVAFMGRACEQIRSGRRFLKWTYAHGYFMKCDEAKKKLFEFHQAQLEGTLERLSDLMENTPWGSYMGDEVISFQPFYDLRTRVISLTSVVCDFFSKLQEALQHENFTPVA